MTILLLLQNYQKILKTMENIQEERHSWLKLTVLLLFLFLYGFLNVIGSGNDINMNLDDAKVITLLKVVQVLGVLIIFILPAFLFAGLWTKARIGYLGILTKPSTTTLFLSGLGILLAMPLINWLGELNQHMHLPAAMSGIEAWMKSSEDKAAELTEAFTKGTSIGSLVSNLLIVAFMAALSEELFFRGIIQKVLIECFKNKHVGIWIGAALFSAFHMQFYGFVPRMLMGAYLGYLFSWSGSLWPGILAHFLNNGMAVFLVWLSNRGVISSDADKIGSEGGEMIYVAVSAVMVIASLTLVYRVEQKRKVSALQE
jgi:membrane protease YdiL (CAAX protease family)